MNFTSRIARSGTRRRIFFVPLLLTLGVMTSSSADDPPIPTQHFVLDPAAGSFKLEVKKRGALSSFAHDHEMDATVYSGTVAWAGVGNVGSASVQIVIATKEIIVRDAKLSDSDRAEVQTRMRSDAILDVDHFPEIAFSTRGVIARPKQADGGQPLAVQGDLTLHGVKRQTTLEVVLRERDADTLEVTGEHALTQSEFGITPYSAMFGTVGVEDVVRLRFKVVARREGAAKDGAK